MKALIIGIVVIVAIAVGLSSPLFFESSVDESLPGRMNAIEEGLTVEMFASMDDSERQDIVEKMSEDVKDMIMDDAAANPTEISEDMGEMDTVNVLRIGTFEGLVGHRADGTAKIIQVSGSDYLRFENFEVTNGPDLRVYLTNDGDVKSGYHLEKLKGSKGNQNYSLDGVDWDQYDTVVIYCQPFRVHFGQAMLDMTG